MKLFAKVRDDLDDFRMLNIQNNHILIVLDVWSDNSNSFCCDHNLNVNKLCEKKLSSVWVRFAHLILRIKFVRTYTDCPTGDVCLYLLLGCLKLGDIHANEIIWKWMRGIEVGLNLLIYGITASTIEGADCQVGAWRDIFVAHFTRGKYFFAKMIKDAFHDHSAFFLLSVCFQNLTEKIHIGIDWI